MAAWRKLCETAWRDVALTRRLTTASEAPRCVTRALATAVCKDAALFSQQHVSVGGNAGEADSEFHEPRGVRAWQQGTSSSHSASVAVGGAPDAARGASNQMWHGARRRSSTWAAPRGAGSVPLGSSSRADATHAALPLSRAHPCTPSGHGLSWAAGAGAAVATSSPLGAPTWHAGGNDGRQGASAAVRARARAWLSTGSRVAASASSAASGSDDDAVATLTDLDVIEVDGRDYLIDMTTGNLYDIHRFVEDDLLIRVEGVSVPEGYTSGTEEDADVDAEHEHATLHDADVAPRALSSSPAEDGDEVTGARAYSDDEFAPWDLENDTVGLGDLMTQYARPEVPRLTSLDDVKKCELVRGHWIETDTLGEENAVVVEGDEEAPTRDASDAAAAATAVSTTDQWELHEVITTLLEEQADDVAVFQLDKTLRDYADFVVIVSGRSRRHVLAMGQRLVMETKQRKIAHRSGGSADRLGARGFEFWVVVAAQPCVVHLFLPEAREYYDLESLWGPGGDGDEDDIL
jgi:ribosome-associated protein